MRYLLTSLLCVFTLSFSAQEACPNPYDGNGDGNVSIGDFLEMLAVFGDTDTDSDGVWDSLDYCVDLAACNYANDPSEPCAYIDVLGVCGGGCEGDGDDDGICDSEDDCVGVLDECGVCNGPGPTEVTIESITILYDSVYAPLIEEWLVYEFGADTVFNYTCAPISPPLTNDNIHEAVDLWLSDEAAAEDTYGHISEWDVSSVTDMSNLFSFECCFNSDISSWDVSSVTNMIMIFAESSFNGDISSWDVSSVTDMRYMFFNSISFNGDISSWDVSSVTNMSDVFYNASSFNGDISSWDVSSVTNMSWMFEGALSLSEENQCLIHTSFSSNSAWPYDWSEFCPAVFNSCGDDIGHGDYAYSTVEIGDQCWFAENCRYLPEVSPSSEGSETEPYYYVYDYQGTDLTAAQATFNYETYGVLYNWPAVMTEGICPSGWHIPSDGEFTQLTDYLGGEGVAGGKMKEAGYDHWNSPNIGATNSSGWTGLPAGFRYHAGPYFQESGSNGYWWTTAEAAPYPLTRNLNDYSGEASQGSMLTEFGCSARCVRD